MASAGLRQAVGISQLFRAIDLEATFSPRFAHKAVLPLCSVFVQKEPPLLSRSLFQALE